MAICIYAPVPAVLLQSALETCEREGRVAFGTNAQQLFEDIDADFGPRIPVIIHPTVHYGDPKGFGKLSFAATYIGFEKADHKGLHKTSAVRPNAVFDPKDPDTAWLGFWEVEDLHMLTKRVGPETLIARGKNKHLPKTFVPHGPLLVDAPFLDLVG
jgi:hypothetical protein